VSWLLRSRGTDGVRLICTIVERCNYSPVWRLRTNSFRIMRVPSRFVGAALRGRPQVAKKKHGRPSTEKNHAFRGRRR
jgi:hypothetical protein